MKKRVLAMLLVMVMALALCACGSSSSSTGTSDTADTPTTDDGGAAADDKADTPDDSGSEPSGPIALTLWGAEEDQDYLKERVEAFKAAYPDQTFDIQIGVESESTAKDTVLVDIEAAADVFAFADDQLGDLVDAGALLKLDDTMSQVLQAYAGKSLDDVKAANAPFTIDASTKDGTLYAFPFSSDNGFFLYYDSTILTEDDVKTWDGLLKAAAEKGGGKKVGMTLSSGWYNAGFFYGAGFTTGRNDDGTTTMDWNGTSSTGITGVQVVQAMKAIAGDSAFMAVADGDMSNQIAAKNLCAAVSGTWDAAAVEAAFGDGYAATILPKFTAGDKEVQTYDAKGCKLMGVNAHSKNTGWAVLLAEYLTNEESQTLRFEARQIGPSNLKALESDAVSANKAIQAVAAQGEYGTFQRVGGKYWDPTATFGEMIAQGKVGDSEDDIQKALDDLVTGVTAAVE